MPPEAGRRNRIWASIWGLDRVSREPSVVAHKDHYSLFRRTSAAILRVELPASPPRTREPKPRPVRRESRGMRTMTASVLAAAASVLVAVVLQSAPSMTSADRPQASTTQAIPPGGETGPRATAPTPVPVNPPVSALDLRSPATGRWSATGVAMIGGWSYTRSLMADLCANPNGVSYRLGGDFKELRTIVGFTDGTASPPATAIVTFGSGGRPLSTVTIDSGESQEVTVILSALDELTIHWRLTPGGSCPRLAFGSPRLR